MAATHYPRRRSDLNIRVVDGEAVVLDRREGLIHQLNHTATYIWERCNGKSTVAEIAAHLAETFDVASESAGQDVAQVVQQLQDLYLLEPRSDRPVVPELESEEDQYVREASEDIGEANDPKRGD